MHTTGASCYAKFLKYLKILFNYKGLLYWLCSKARWFNCTTGTKKFCSRIRKTAFNWLHDTGKYGRFDAPVPTPCTAGEYEAMNTT